MAHPRKPYTDSKARRAPQHSFRFVIGGKTKPIKTKVRPLRVPFRLFVAEAHVLRAIEINGFGDGQNCAGAVCSRDNAASMPFKFTGYVDFQDRRAYFSCRNSAENNLPTHCVAAAHRSDVARLFDNKKGLEKLLSMIRKDGPLEITFYPLPPSVVGTPKGKQTGERTKKKPRGHNLRVMRALEGGNL